jgi:hypothetical protein
VEDERPEEGTVGKRWMMTRSREVSLKHDRHTSMPEIESEKRGGLEVGPAEVAPVAAVDVVEGSTAGRLVEDTAQFGKTAQMRLVRLELQMWDRGMCSHLHHRLLNLVPPPVRPDHDPGGVVRPPRRQVGEVRRQQVETR